MSIAVYIWLALLVVFILAEALTAQMVSMWFIIGSIAGGVAAMVGMRPWIQILVFIVVSAIALLLFRPLVKKRLTSNPVPTNADRYVGRIAIVEETIDNVRATGRVIADGVHWTARSYYGDVLPENSRCMIYSIDGAKLIVGPIKED